MTQTYHTSGNPKAAVGDAVNDTFARLIKAADTIRTAYAGGTDPSTGASPSWGASEVGTPWEDSGVDGTAQNPVRKVWAQLTGTPTYGWRRVRTTKRVLLDSDASVTTVTGSPAAADVAWTDASLATLLDSYQDAGQTTHRVASVILRCRVKPGSSETLAAGTDDCYLAIRKKGATHERRIYGQVAGRWNEEQVEVGLDASEVMQFSVKVGGGTPSFAYEVSLVGLFEDL